MKKTEYLLKLIYPPVCASCNEPMPIKREDFLCEECRTKWEDEKNEICYKCNQPINNCWCGVSGDGSRYIDSERHLTQYRKTQSVTKNLLYFCKNHNNKDTFDYLSKEMVEELCDNISENTVVCAIPRSPSKKRFIGHDQACELATGIAERLDLEIVDVLYHTGDAVQKTLPIAERRANAESSYKIKSGITKQIKNKDILLVDDVVTTGASATRCAYLLKVKGAKTVKLITVSKTV